MSSLLWVTRPINRLLSKAWRERERGVEAGCVEGEQLGCARKDHVIGCGGTHSAELQHGGFYDYFQYGPVGVATQTWICQQYALVHRCKIKSRNDASVWHKLVGEDPVQSRRKTLSLTRIILTVVCTIVVAQPYTALLMCAALFWLTVLPVNVFNLNKKLMCALLRLNIYDLMSHVSHAPIVLRLPPQRERQCQLQEVQINNLIFPLRN